MPKEVEEDEPFGFGDGLGGDLAFVFGLAGTIPYALFTSDPRTPGA